MSEWIDLATGDFKDQIKVMQMEFAAKSISVSKGVEQAVLDTITNIELTAKEKMDNAVVDMNKSIKRGDGRYHHPSVPGSAPAVDSGTMKNSITHEIHISGDSVSGAVGSTITNPPYPSYLETGTSKMAERPWLLPSVRENADFFESAMYKAVKNG